MELLLYKTLWGHAGSYEGAARQALSAGFDGLEARVPDHPAKLDQLLEALDEHGLDYIAEVVTGGDYVPLPRAGPERHLHDLDLALGYARTLRARFVTCIAGYDAWSFDASVDFLLRAMDLGEKHDVVLSFETHRSRILFNPWITLQLLERLPELRLTCDFSHWCVVCERLIDTEHQVLEAVFQRARHIHARVGYDQGPQVPHPAAPEYAPALAAHQRWWQRIWEVRAGQGETVCTMTPEFGPDGYLHCLPFTEAPVADLWEINKWMGSTERARFAAWRGESNTGTEAP